MTILTRLGKGTELTYTELDGNFTDLDTRTKSGWRDIVDHMQSRGGSSEPPYSLFRGNIWMPAFSHIDMQECYAQFNIGHDYAMGTTLYPLIHWSVDTTTIGTVRWGFEYSIAKGHQQMAFTEPVTVYVNQTTDGTIYKHYIAEIADADAISGTLIEPDTIILCRIFRDSTNLSDNYDGHAFGICTSLHYQADKLTTINKKPNFFG